MFKKSLLVTAVLLLASTAYAGSIAVNVGSNNSGSMVATDTAGVVPVAQWTNFNTGSASNLVDGTGTATGAAIAQAGGAQNNFPNYETAGVLATGDGKMMRDAVGTFVKKAYVSFADPILYENNSSGAPTNYTFTGLNAATGGATYDVYVYIDSSCAYPNEVGFPGSTAGMRSDSNPVHIWAGPANLMTRLSTGLTSNYNMVTANNESAYLGSSDYHFVAWPTDDFSGTYTEATTGGLMGAGCPNDAWAVPPSWSDAGAPVYSAWSLAAWHDPATRFGTSAVRGNYIKISGVNFDTLVIAAKNVYGQRPASGSGWNNNDCGGIAGIQIVWSDAPPVAEPAGLGLLGLALLGLRKRRS